MLPSAWAQAPETATPDAASAAAELRYTIGKLTVRRFTTAGVERTAISRDGGASWREVQQPDDRLHTIVAVFDPLTGMPDFPGVMAAPAGTRLFLVQFQTTVLADYRDALQRAGVEVLHFLPADALVVRADAAALTAVRALPCVRWVGAMPNAFKLDAELRAFVQNGGEAREVNLVLARKQDRNQLAGQVKAIGGTVTDLGDGSILIRATVTAEQLTQVMSLDTFLWADPVTPIGYDMDNARIQGGGNYVEAMAGFLGAGVRAEITEYFEETHPDFAGRFVVRGTNSVASHGHCTAGIVAGAGANNASARGMMPLCTVIEGGYTSSAAHYAQITGSPVAPWNSMQATSSWGSAQTPNYTATSASVDDALFDADFVRTQSMSNLGNQNVRPEAWPKNSISVGGVSHGNNSNPLDDVWTSASIGPASDGRLKPEICAYYDNVLTSDRTSTSGYNTTAGVAGDYYTGFNGTSSATPIVNGHVGIIQEMFTNGLFGNPLPQPATSANRFANRPHASTVKALLTNTAAQYTFSGTGANLSRYKQGWGFPDLARLYDNRNKIVVLDEYDTLQVGQTRTYLIWVASGTPELRVTMVYADPSNLALAAIHLINNANLKVTRLADGTFWWGNNGLAAGNFSTTGGVANDRDNLEAVYVQNPTAGLYRVEITAAAIAQDAKVETPQVDMDFALAMHPMGGGYQTTGGLTLDLSSTGPGNLTFAASSVPAAGWTDGYTALSFATAQGRGFGDFLGLAADGLTVALWATAAAPGNPFHFTNTGGVYPFASFVFPNPAIISLLAGIKVDGVIVLFNGGDVTAVSNVDRITLQ
ncbi:MAG: S8 family serine peptidase [Planctomycetota bacterium]